MTLIKYIPSLTENRNDIKERNYNYGSELADDFSTFRCAPIQYENCHTKIDDLDRNRNYIPSTNPK